MVVSHCLSQSGWASLRICWFGGLTQDCQVKKISCFARQSLCSISLVFNLLYNLFFSYLIILII